MRSFPPQNGHTLLVEVSHKKNAPAMMDMKRRVRIVFDGADTITVTVDEHDARQIRIDANQEGCFLKLRNQEITPDAFSEFALKDALLTPRIPESPGSPTPKWDWS
jgi:hypothetical protein